MVRVAVLVLLCIASHTAMATTLMARVDRHALVLGESLRLEITARTASATPPLDGLLLDALNADFYVLDVSRNTQAATRNGRVETTQMLTATLYPLRSGRLKIPVLNILHASSPALEIIVQESGATIPRVVLRSGIEPNPPHARETVLLYLDVYDNGGLVWSAVEAPTAPGLYLRELTQARREARIDGEAFKVVRHRWAATPLREGDHTIQFPLLRANKFGVRLRYAAPPLKFTAQAVPGYVPVVVPVGPAPELRVETLPQDIIVNRPVNWQFSVTGTGLSENGLTQLLSTTLGATPEIRFYPLKIEAEDAMRSTTLEQTFRVTLPFQAQHSGDVELPEVSIPYFDPQLEQLNSIVLAKQRITAVSPVRQVMLWIGGAGLGIIVLAWPVRCALVELRRQRGRRRGLRRIERAEDIQGLKIALLKFDAHGAERHQASMTLRQWLRDASVTYKIDANLRGLVFQLERHCYVTNMAGENFPEFKGTLLRNLKQLRRNRWLAPHHPSDF